MCGAFRMNFMKDKLYLMKLSLCTPASLVYLLILISTSEGCVCSWCYIIDGLQHQIRFNALWEWKELPSAPSARPKVYVAGCGLAACLPWSGSRCVSSAVACHLGDNWPFPTKPLLPPLSLGKCQCSAAFYYPEWTPAPWEAAALFDHPQQYVCFQTLGKKKKKFPWQQDRYILN